MSLNIHKWLHFSFPTYKYIKSISIPQKIILGFLGEKLIRSISVFMDAGINEEA